MAAWITLDIALTAQQAAGTVPILAADNAGPNSNRRVFAFCNRSSTVGELIFGGGGLTTKGLKVAVDASANLFQWDGPCTGDIYFIGGVAGDHVTIIVT